MHIDELKQDMADMHAGVKVFIARHEAALAEERKEREELEAKLNRLGILGGGPIVQAGSKGVVSTADRDKELKALGKFIHTGDDTEFKTMSVGVDPDGGYTVTPYMSGSMTTRLFDLSPMRQICTVQNITKGDTFEEIDDRGEANATWVGEIETRNVGATPKIGLISIPVREIYALQPITQKLLDTSDLDLGNWITNKIDNKFARTEGTAYLSGNGMSAPTGLLTYAVNADPDLTRAIGTIQYIPGGGSTDFPADPAGPDALERMIWALRAPYRSGASWMMNSNTASRIDRMKNSNGDYIWRDGMTAGAPASLLGYPVAINEDMPDVAANAYPVAFGNFKLAYYIVDRDGVKTLRDPFTAKPKVLFYAYKRTGGGLANDDAVKLLKIATS